jgi:hypothetical protein
MGETMQPHTIKYGERHVAMIVAIRERTQPFTPSVSHVFRVSLERLYQDFCIPETVRRDAHPGQALQGHIESPKVIPRPKYAWKGLASSPEEADAFLKEFLPQISGKPGPARSQQRQAKRRAG